MMLSLFSSFWFKSRSQPGSLQSSTTGSLLPSAGDDVSRFNGDTISEPGDTGLVFFNRWQFSAKESLITKVFLILNIVSILGAKFILQAVAQINEQFQTPFPFGLSYASYSLMVGLAFSMLQWYGAGLAFEIVKIRYFTRKDPLGKA